MKNKLMIVIGLGVALLAGGALHAEEQDEEIIPSSQVPAVVKKAAEKVTEGGKLVQWEKEGKNYEAIIPLATLYIERYPRNNWGWSMRGWAHIERKEYDAAASDYKMGAQYNSSYAQEGLAWLTEWGYGGMKQDYRKAIELYEIAAANGSTTAGAKAERVRQGIGLKAPAASVK